MIRSCHLCARAMALSFPRPRDPPVMSAIFDMGRRGGVKIFVRYNNYVRGEYKGEWDEIETKIALYIFGEILHFHGPFRFCVIVMKELLFVTGNQNKVDDAARYLTRYALRKG